MRTSRTDSLRVIFAGLLLMILLNLQSRLQGSLDIQFLTARYEKGKQFIESWMTENHNYAHMVSGQYSDGLSKILEHRRDHGPATP